MKFINSNGLEIAVKPGKASARGLKENGDELVVKFEDELAGSINYLYDLDIYELEKLIIKNKRKQES